MLAGVNAQTPSAIAFLTKTNQLFLERHFDEAIRLIHSRLTEYRDLSDIERLFAVLGEKDAAIKEAERAITLRPTVKDAVDGPTNDENLAFVEVLVGDKNRAIPTLQRLLEIPYR